MNRNLFITLTIPFKCVSTDTDTWEVDIRIHNNTISTPFTFYPTASSDLPPQVISLQGGEEINFLNQQFYPGANHITLMEENGNITKKIFFLGKCENDLMFYATQKTACLEGSKKFSFSVNNNLNRQRFIRFDFGDGTFSNIIPLRPFGSNTIEHTYNSFRRGDYNAFLEYDTVQFGSGSPLFRIRIPLSFDRCPFDPITGKSFQLSCINGSPQLYIRISPWGHEENITTMAFLEYGDGERSETFPLSSPPLIEHTYPSGLSGQGINLKLCLEDTPVINQLLPLVLPECSPCGGVEVNAEALGYCHEGQQHIILKVNNTGALPISGEWYINEATAPMPVTAIRNLTVGQSSQQFIFLNPGIYHIEFRSDTCTSSFNITVNCCPEIALKQPVFISCTDQNQKAVVRFESEVFANEIPDESTFLWSVTDTEGNILIEETTETSFLENIEVNTDQQYILTLTFTTKNCGTKTARTEFKIDSNQCLSCPTITELSHTVISCDLSGNTATIEVTATINGEISGITNYNWFVRNRQGFSVNGTSSIPKWIVEVPLDKYLLISLSINDTTPCQNTFSKDFIVRQEECPSHSCPVLSNIIIQQDGCHNNNRTITVSPVISGSLPSIFLWEIKDENNIIIQTSSLPDFSFLLPIGKTVTLTLQISGPENCRGIFSKTITIESCPPPPNNNSKESLECIIGRFAIVLFMTLGLVALLFIICQPSAAVALSIFALANFALAGILMLLYELLCPKKSCKWVLLTIAQATIFASLLFLHFTNCCINSILSIVIGLVSLLAGIGMFIRWIKDCNADMCRVMAEVLLFLTQMTAITALINSIPVVGTLFGGCVNSVFQAIIAVVTAAVATVVIGCVVTESNQS